MFQDAILFLHFDFVGSCAVSDATGHKYLMEVFERQVFQQKIQIQESKSFNTRFRAFIQQMYLSVKYLSENGLCCNNQKSAACDFCSRKKMLISTAINRSKQRGSLLCVVALSSALHGLMNPCLDRLLSARGRSWRFAPGWLLMHGPSYTKLELKSKEIHSPCKLQVFCGGWNLVLFYVSQHKEEGESGSGTDLNPSDLGSKPTQQTSATVTPQLWASG